MATTHNYTFDEISRIGNDSGISERDMQNNKFGSYLTQIIVKLRYDRTYQPATSQPNVYYTGGVGVTESCTVIMILD